LYLFRIPLCAADRSIPAVESIAGDEAAAAELDRLARLMEQQAILEKVPYRTSSPEDFASLNENYFLENLFCYIRSVPVRFLIYFIILFSMFCCNMTSICDIVLYVHFCGFLVPVSIWYRTTANETLLYKQSL
jgi:hypothetical protein